MKKLPWLVLAVFVAVAGVWLLRARGPETPEDEIRQALDEAARAAEAQDIRGVMALVSPSFASELGDRAALNAFLFFQLKRGAWRKVFLVDTRVALEPGVTPTRARVTTKAVLASGQQVRTLADVAPDSAGAQHIDMQMVREDDGRWRVVSAEHQAIDLRGLVQP